MPTVAAHDPAEAQSQVSAAGVGEVPVGIDHGDSGTVPDRPERVRQLRGRQGGGPGDGSGPITSSGYVNPSSRVWRPTPESRPFECRPVTGDGAHGHHLGLWSESPFWVSYVRPKLSDRCARVDGLADHIQGSFDPLFREPYVGGGETG